MTRALESSYVFGDVVQEWRSGQAVPDVSRGMAYGVTQVVVGGQLVGDTPVACVLRLGAQAVAGDVVLPDGRRVRVHTFRVVLPGKVPAWFRWCASCGYGVCAVAPAELEAAVGDCPGCGATLAPWGQSCASWHNWGACLKCPHGVKGGYDRARAIGSAVGTAANKRGPGTPSHGSAVVDAGSRLG